MTSEPAIYPLRYAQAWLAGGYLVLVAIVFGSLLPGLPGPDIAGSDKIVHFSVYLALMLWFAGIYLPHRHWRAMLLLAAVGAGLELVQAFSVSRQGDWQDVAANVAGLGVGLALARMGLAGWCLVVERHWLRKPGA